jgi:glycosyltransferase involved in cell wall biosynthesis
MRGLGVKIAIVAAGVHGGGTEYVARTWIELLGRLGHTVTFVDLDEPGQRRLRQVQSVRRVRSAVVGQQFDAVLAMATYPALVTLTALKLLPGVDTKVLISERNMPSILLRNGGPTQRLQLRLAQRLYRLADAAIAVSHPVGSDLVSSFDLAPEKIFVVPNPLAKVSQSRPRRRATGPEITLVLPSRLVPQKRPLIAVDVARELNRRGRPTRIIAFGRGELGPELARAAESAGVSVDLRGWEEQWFDHVPAESVVLLPSFCEGFPNVILEAAAVGLPSVAISNALGVADAVIPGVTGELALSAQPGELADAVERAAELDVRVDGWLRRFSPENSVRVLESVFLAVTGDRRPDPDALAAPPSPDGSTPVPLPLESREQMGAPLDHSK